MGRRRKRESTSAEVASILGMILTFIIYMFIIMYGGMVMQGVMEEKTNRIIEVMISSVKPFDLMMGKIIVSVRRPDTGIPVGNPDNRIGIGKPFLFRWQHVA